MSIFLYTIFFINIWVTSLLGMVGDFSIDKSLQEGPFKRLAQEIDDSFGDTFFDTQVFCYRNTKKIADNDLTAKEYHKILVDYIKKTFCGTKVGIAFPLKVISNLKFFEIFSDQSTKDSVKKHFENTVNDLNTMLLNASITKQIIDEKKDLFFAELPKIIDKKGSDLIKSSFKQNADIMFRDIEKYLLPQEPNPFYYTYEQDCYVLFSNKLVLYIIDSLTLIPKWKEVIGRNYQNKIEEIVKKWNHIEREEKKINQNTTIMISNNTEKTTEITIDSSVKEEGDYINWNQCTVDFTSLSEKLPNDVFDDISYCLKIIESKLLKDLSDLIDKKQDLDEVDKNNQTEINNILLTITNKKNQITSSITQFNQYYLRISDVEGRKVIEKLVNQMNTKYSEIMNDIINTLGTNNVKIENNHILIEIRKIYVIDWNVVDIDYQKQKLNDILKDEYNDNNRNIFLNNFSQLINDIQNKVINVCEQLRICSDLIKQGKFTLLTNEILKQCYNQVVLKYIEVIENLPMCNDFETINFIVSNFDDNSQKEELSVLVVSLMSPDTDLNNAQKDLNSLKENCVDLSRNEKILYQKLLDFLNKLVEHRKKDLDQRDNIKNSTPPQQENNISIDTGNNNSNTNISVINDTNINDIEVIRNIDLSNVNNDSVINIHIIKKTPQQQIINTDAGIIDDIRDQKNNIVNKNDPFNRIVKFIALPIFSVLDPLIGITYLISSIPEFAYNKFGQKSNKSLQKKDLKFTEMFDSLMKLVVSILLVNVAHFKGLLLQPWVPKWYLYFKEIQNNLIEKYFRKKPIYS